MWLGLSGLCAAVLSLAGLFLYLDPQVPRAESYRNVQLETPLRIYAEDGALLAEFGERRLIPISLANVPAHFVNALLDTEDKRFYQHSGIDFISLANNSVGLAGSLITGGDLGPGASTITMQLARNVSFTLERRFLRKFKEMLLALKIERELTKDEILELYINMVPFGKRAYGAEAAAQTYYGKSLAELDLAQLAMLAGVPQRPSANNPINGPEAALRRRNLVLLRMFEQGSISSEEYEQARAAPISARIYDRELDVASPYAAEWARRLALSTLPDLYTGGYEIFTTINSRYQASAIQALRKGLEAYDHKHGYRGAEAQLPAELLTATQDAATSALRYTTDAAEPASSAASDNDPSQTQSAPPPPPPSLNADYDPELLTRIADFVRIQPIYGGLQPAAVLAVDDHHALVTLGDRSILALHFADSTWARAYVDVDRRGPVLKAFSEVLSSGDLIRVQPGPERWQLTQLPEIQGALVSLDPDTGRVKSLVGGFDFYRNQYNHALQAARQPGSGFKPFVYSAALANGVTPASIYMDAPLVFDDSNLEAQYRPDNDNNQYNGPTRLREALYRSINLVSIRVLLDVGAGNVLEHASQLGFDTREFPRNTQLAIGGGTMAVTPMQMAQAYAIFANGGYLIDPYIIDHIKDAEGEIIFRSHKPMVCDTCDETEEVIEDDLFEPASLSDLLAASPVDDAQADPDLTVEPAQEEPALSAESPAETEFDPLLEPAPIYAERVLDEANAFVMHSMLTDVIRRGTGISARRALQRTDLAGKTGTTNDAADTWFNGFHEDLVTTVWVGFSNHAPLGATAFGSNTPLPIWTDYMGDVIGDLPVRQQPQPTDVVSVKIDPETGELALPGRRDAMFEYFIRGTEPERTAEAPRPDLEEESEPVNAVDLF